MIEKQRVVRKKKSKWPNNAGEKTITLREFHSSVAKRLVMCSES